MITNGAFFVLLTFAILIGYRDLSQQHHLSVNEDYYQGIMLLLEGALTEEKEKLILSERARYKEAFENLEKIDEMVSMGKMSPRAAS